MIAPLFALLLMAAPPDANHWTATDTGLETAFAVTLAVDMSTTLDIRERCLGGSGHMHCHESNPLLGHYPERPRVLEYGAGCLLLHAGIAKILPKPYRTIWQSVWIAGEAGASGRNVALGFQLRY